MPKQIQFVVSRALIVIAFLTVLYRAADVPIAQAATRIVSDCSVPSGAAGRLVDVITAASAGDTITFSCSGTITLSSTITLDKNLIIDGSGQTVSISGGDTVGVFVVNSGMSVTLSHLTIAHGYNWRGGGIGNWGILTVTDSTLSANRAQNPGGVGYYGGGIYNGGTLTVTNSTLSGNIASYVSGTPGGGGGGIYNVATLVVVNSTLTGNSTVGNSWSDVGAGISQYGGSLTLRNSTLYGNNSGNAVGSGIYNQGGVLNYANTIIYPTTTTNYDCYSTVAPATNTNNLVKNSNGCGTPALTSDPLLGALANNGGSTQTMVPSLSPRSPVINAGSDAVCAASPVNGLDQRGITRPNGAHCDIGAVELVLPSTKDITDFRFNSLGVVGTINGTNITVLVPLGTNVTALVPTITHTGVSISPNSGVAQNFTNSIVYTVTADDTSTKTYTVTVIACNPTITVANTSDTGAGSIRQAIADVCPGGTINFDASLSGINIGLNTQLVIAKNVTIDASALSAWVGLSGSSAHRVLYINGTNVTLNRLMIYAGRTASPDVDGGGIFNQGNLTILNGYIWGNTATNNGGGIYNAGTLTVTNSTLQSNQAVSGGGLLNAGTATVTGSTIYNNYVSSEGAGIYNEWVTPNLTVSNSTFRGNRADAAGGGIASYGGLNVTNSTFSDNGTAGFFGSDIFQQSSGALSLANSILANSNGGFNCYAGGSVTSVNNLIEGDANCGAALTADPALGLLGSNGGSTETMLPGTGSPAIDAGNDTVCAASPVNGRDQRGMPRPQGAHCDLGAVEVGDVTQKNITSFTFASPAATGVIGTNTIAVTVLYGTNVTALVPTITHTGASMSPASGVAQNFTGPIVYTVTAVDGSTKAYTVNVTVALNPAKSITSFTIPGQIGGTMINEAAGTIALTVPYGSLTALVPTIVHTGASVSPASGVAHDFTNPTIYTVTAADGSTKAYTVTVTMQCGSAITVANANNSGVGSLRQAIIDLCAGGTITFGGDYTILLGSTLTLGKNLTIDAASRIVTVDGQNAVRVFDVSSSVTTVLNNLTIAHGATGGNGGGINNAGTLTVKNSTFVANSGYLGGGIYNNATLTVANSTFANNIVTDGGGIFNDTAGSLTLLNSTFSGNTANWAGGSLFTQGTLNYANNILANSTLFPATTGMECAFNGGTLGTNLNNLVEDGSCSATLNGDPNLGSLASNSGRTQTFALLPGSPAIDAGHDTTCAAAPVSGKDQRGLNRPLGTHCDIGAYEYATKEITAFNFASPAATGVIAGSNITLTVPYGTNLTALVPTITHNGSSVSPASGVAQNFTNPVIYTVTASDGSTHAYTVTVVMACGSNITVGNANDTGAGSLRQAITDLCAGGTITFGGDYSVPLGGTLTLGKNMTIDAAGRTVTVDGQNAVRVFVVNSGVTAVLNNLTIANGNTGGGGAGGGISNLGTLTVKNSTLASNTANAGGGIYNAASLTVANSTFSANYAAWGQNGGGIYNDGTVTLLNATFSGNRADWGGGSIFNVGTLNFANTIMANSTIGGGGLECFNYGGTIGINLNNLVENGSGCSATFIADPQLGPLASNGGRTQTFALLPSSPAIDVGDDATCAAVPISSLDQRGQTRSRGAHCDIGAYEYAPKEITAFNFASPATTGMIAGNAIALTVPYGTNLTALVPTIVHTGSSVSPASGVAQNFTDPVIYTVTASDGSTHAYTATVTMACSSAITVANANDTGLGSLRQAIADLCTGGTITFGGDYSIPLGSTLTLGKNMTIDATGRTVTVDGQTAVRVFNVNSGVTAVLNNLTIAKGNTGGAGGGIYNDGTLTVKNSTFMSNTSSAGGGIYNAASLTVVNSTFSGNNAAWGNDGGGIYNESTGTVTLLNTTFSGNIAGWGGGSIFNVGTLNFANTIMANSTIGGGGLECFNYGGTIGVNINNLVEGGAGCAATFIADPQLGPLASNSGRTQTFALLPGSPALDAGDDATCTAAPVSGHDQRGVIRPGGAHCDLGAYEEAPKEITAFTFASPAATGIIAGDNIAVTVPYGTNVTALVPTITHNGSSINPASGVAQNFTSPIEYTVTASDGTTKVYTVTVTVALNSAKSITAFTIPGQVGGSTINEVAGTIAITVPYGTNVTALVPTITHSGASINPAGGAAQDFTNPIGYTVTAEDASTKVYTVTVTVALNPAKSITSFTIPSQVGGASINEVAGTIAIVMPYGTDVTALVPTITHTGASLNPASGVAQDFTNPIGYTVTAADGSTKVYLVTVTWQCSLAITVANANNSGAGSLRQAIADVCSSGTITFAPSLSGATILLASQLNLNHDLTIDGSTLTTTITLDGQNTTRIVNISSSVTAVLRGLTIAHGNSGVAGGGIYSYFGIVTLTNVTLIGNYGAEGGGVFNDRGTLTVVNSTLSGNIAEWSGGGIYNYYGTLRLTNNTLSGNRTNRAYGGGLYNFGTLHYANTIIANSTAGGDCVQDGGSIATNLNNLVEDGGCSAAGVNFKTGDPHLDVLQNNGGSTSTFELQLDSPAIDAGDAAACASAPVSGLDQRGQTRDDLQCDIGAFELKYTDSPTVTKAVSGASTYTFGPTMIKIVVNNTGPSGCLTGITIQRYNANHPNATSAIQTGHWWDITPVGCTSGFNVDLTLPTDFTPDTDDKVCRWNPGGPGYQWDCAVNSSTSSSLTRNGVTGFSQWAAGNNAGPTAVTLNSLTARGESAPAGGVAFGGLLVLASVGTLGWRRRRVR